MVGQLPESPAESQCFFYYSTLLKAAKTQVNIKVSCDLLDLTLKAHIKVSLLSLVNMTSKQCCRLKETSVTDSMVIIDA